jgi:hybrid cluster-associated redox disulfide protein
LEDNEKMPDKINKNMTFGEVMKNFPKSAQIMAGYGLHCIGCHISTSETIEEGAQAHGFDSNTLQKMLTELNERAV